MHLLAREEIGLRCLVRVASHASSGPLTIPTIARSEGLSPEYAAKLLRQLRLAELVRSTRGAGGGYRLARPASEITVWQVLQALDEDQLTGHYCDCSPGERADCRRTTHCTVAGLWRRVASQLQATLEGTTLQQLCPGEATPSGDGRRTDLPMHERPAPTKGEGTWPRSK